MPTPNANPDMIVGSYPAETGPLGSTTPHPSNSIHPVPLQTRQPDPSQAKHDTCISADGSVNGKKCGRKRTLLPEPKNALAKYSSVPLRSAKGMSVSTARPP